MDASKIGLPGVDSDPAGWMEPKRKAYLVPQADGEAPIALRSPQWVVGRGDNLDCQIPDPRASRRHARVLAVHNRYYVQDLGSTNGTFVNGRRVTHERLIHGDLVGFGKTLFRLVVTADPDRDYLRQLDLEALTVLAQAADDKDPYTGSHSEAVSRLAERLALALGLSPADAQRVGIAGRLHDIGKIGVPTAALRKAGRLDEAERAPIRQHPSEGAAILEPLPSFADMVPMVRQHHERFDGRGYPDGLRGQAIAVGARIVQVADAYHAMASQRPYREPLFQEFVRQELTKGAGVQFDPEIARALAGLLPAIPRLLATVQ